MRKIRLTESDLVRLVKRVISENPVPTTIIRNLLRGGFLTNAVNALDELLVLRQIDNNISSGSGASSIRITNGNQVLDHFLNNRLKPVDQQTVFNQIFRTSTDDQLIDELSRWLVRHDSFINTYRNATPNQVYQALEPVYGARQARRIADEFSLNPFNPIVNPGQYGFPPGLSPQQVQNAYEALRNMYATNPKALKIIDKSGEILKRISNTNDETFRQSVYQNQQFINQQLQSLGLKQDAIKWFWSEIKKSPASKFAFHATWSIVLLAVVAFIFRMFEASGISAIGSAVEIVFGPNVRENLDVKKILVGYVVILVQYRHHQIQEILILDN
jgi:hypothetical protein